MTGKPSENIQHLMNISTIDLNLKQFEDPYKTMKLDEMPNEIQEYRGPKIWRILVNNWSTISQILALLIVFFTTWSIAYILFPNYTRPESTLMRIAFLFIGAQLSGIIVSLIYLPDMLGMLFFGVFYTNIGLADFRNYEGFEAFLREMALINIMLLAGLGLDLKAFKKVYGIVMRLTILPTAVEVVIIAILGYFLLDMPWLWSFLMGLVITAVSPNVVVTIMLQLKELKLGLNNGIHTIIYAMTACNDVLAIFLFGVILGVIFSTGSLTEQLLQGPVGIIIGVVYGFIFGLMLLYIPSKQSKYATSLHFILSVIGGTVSIIGSKHIGYPSAGVLGCVIMMVVCKVGWQRESLNEDVEVANRLDLLWKFLKPISFSLIGKEVNFAILDMTVVGYGVVLISVGCLLRLLVSFISTYGGSLTWQERAYITISSFPKATVQAALGPIALDLARKFDSNKDILLANYILIVSVIAIILTAPLGAVLMIRLAPIWLKKFQMEA